MTSPAMSAVSFPATVIVCPRACPGCNRMLGLAAHPARVHVGDRVACLARAEEFTVANLVDLGGGRSLVELAGRARETDQVGRGATRSAY